MAPPVAAAPARVVEPDPTKPLVKVGLKRNGENLSLTFPFASPTPAAVFIRADTLWLVFDTAAAIDLGKLDGESNRPIKTATASQVAERTVAFSPFSVHS